MGSQYNTHISEVPRQEAMEPGPGCTNAPLWLGEGSSQGAFISPHSLPTVGEEERAPGAREGANTKNPGPGSEKTGLRHRVASPRDTGRAPAAPATAQRWARGRKKRKQQLREVKVTIPGGRTERLQGRLLIFLTLLLEF